MMPKDKLRALTGDERLGHMYKIKTGQLATPKIIQAICEILDLPEQSQDTKSEGQ